MRSFRFRAPLQFSSRHEAQPILQPRPHLPPSAELPIFIRGLHEALTSTPTTPQLTLPNLYGTPGLHVFSDFSARLGDWRTAAFLITPSSVVNCMIPELTKLRAKLKLHDNRRVEYKSLRDKVRWHAVQHWLQAFDSMHGVAFVLLARQDVLSAVSANLPSELDENVAFVRDTSLGDWASTSSGPRLLEELIRVVHCVGYWHASLAGPAAHLSWISDNDEIFDGPVRRSTANRMLELVLEKYSGKSVAHHFATEAETPDSGVRDFLSIPDLLAAGVLEHQLGTDAGAQDMIAKSAVIMHWLRDVKCLQKIVLSLTGLSDGRVFWKLHRPYFEPRVSSD